MAQQYPLPRFYFQVDLGKYANFSVTEVTGLVMEREKIEYRHSDSPDFSKIIMPGMIKHSNITIKRGIFDRISPNLVFGLKMLPTNKSKRSDLPLLLLNEK